MPDSIVERIAEAARRAELAPVADDVADVLWFASQITVLPGRPPETEDPPDDPDSDAERDPAEESDAAGDEAPDADPPEPDPSDGEPPPLEPTDGTTHDGPVGRPGDEAPATPGATGDFDVWPHVGRAPVAAVPLRVPDAPALTRLKMARALRPLKRSVSTDDPGEVDAVATAHQAAETDVLMPIFVPLAERWLDVAVVVDEAPSMAVSGQTVHDLVAILRELGAFRDVRVWHYDSDSVSGPIGLRGGTPPATEHHPGDLVHPNGRRAILVVSDCLGAAWRDGQMADALEVWAKAGPVAVVQPLPQRLWDECGPPVRSVTLSSLGPGVANRDLAVSFTDEPLDLVGAGPGTDATPVATGIPVPLIELGARWLASWAALVAGTATRLPGRALFTDQMRQYGAEATPRPTATPGDPELIVADFVQTASRDAQRLATLLAAAAPLTLPIMRLVQRTMLPSASPTALREVFLGNLLERVSEPPEARAAEDSVYDFLHGVRNELIGNLDRGEGLAVLVAVSRYLASRLGTNFDFLALLALPQAVADLDDSARAFATVAADVLESMGGTYREKAERLKRLLTEDQTNEPPTPDRDSSAETAATDTPVIETTGEVLPPSVVASNVRDGAVVTARTHTAYSAARRGAGRFPAGWTTVPPRNPNFVGRDSMLDRLRTMLVNSAQTAVLLPRALYGHGGVGKTQLAIEYANRHSDDYDLIWWIAAEDPTEIRRSLVELARELEIPITDDTGVTIHRVKEALATRQRFPRWLLVFDNVGEPETVEDLVPQTSGGHVLITSRVQAWEDRGQAVEVDKFDRTESLALLREHGGLVGADAEAIAQRLGDLPISLAQAAAWHLETRQPVAAYLRRFDEEMRRHTGESESLGYPPEAAAAMSIAFGQLRDGSPDSARLLQLASYFGPEWISLDLLHRGRLATPLSRQLGRVLRDQAPLQRAVKEISRWELARYDTRNLRFQVHRLVARMVREEMPAELRTQVRETVQTMLAYANPGNPDRIAPNERAKHTELSAHITASGLIESDDPEARQVVLDQIRYRYLIGDYESSRRLAADALRAWERSIDDPDDEMTLLARRHLANALKSLGELDKGLEIDQDVVTRFRDTLGDDHEHTMATAANLAHALRALGRFREARGIDEDVLARQRRVLGVDDRYTLRTANNLAVDLRMVGRYAEALELDEQGFSTLDQVFGPEDRDTLLLASNVARDLYALGRYGEALRRQRESLPRHELAVGPDHPNVLAARRTVVMCLRKLGRRGDAVDAARTLLLAHRNRLGAYHPDTLLVMQSLTNALRDNRELAEAIAMGEDAQERYRNNFPDHPFARVCDVNVAIVLRQAGRTAQARRLNEAALRDLSDAFGEDHPYTLCCASNLASDLAAAGELTAAREMSRATLERSRSVRGADQPYTLACAVNHALDLIATGDGDAGHQLLDETVAVMRANPDFGEAHPDVELATEGKRIDSDIEPPPT